MNRRDLLGMLGLGQLGKLPPFHKPPESEKDPPICYGVISGIDIEIDCPEDERELCPQGHLQHPAYTIDLDLSRGDERKTLVLKVCGICGGAFVSKNDLPEVPKEPGK